jgi:hypothetical protein
VVFAEGIPETASSDPPSESHLPSASPLSAASKHLTVSWDDLCPAFEDFENTER